MKIRPHNSDAYRLLHEASAVFAQIERNGVRIDVPYLDSAIKKTEAKLTAIEAELKSQMVWLKIWKHKFGDGAKLSSNKQLADIMYKEIQLKPKYFTDRGNPSVNKQALANTNNSFFSLLSKRNELEKTLTTFLFGIRREVIGDRIHPFFNLHTATTYRSSSSCPNFHNFPSRDDESAKLVRRCMIPSDGYYFREDDFKGSEICISACHNKDPQLIKYIKDTSLDMHRDMAEEIFFLKQEQVSKGVRYCAKNKFVFPEFYGNYYKQVAADLWDYMEQHDLRRKANSDDKELNGSGKRLIDVLRKNGIERLGDCDPEQDPRLGTFEYHIKQIEEDFWNKRFPVYTAAKKRWWNEYLENGWFALFSGFICEGLFRRNQVLNFRVQGDSFHCLLWCLVQLQKKMNKYKMKSLLVGQIHDSIESDIHPKEMRAYHELLNKIVHEDLPRHWKWLIVPMTVECEVAEQDLSWYDKVPFHLPA